MVPPAQFGSGIAGVAVFIFRRVQVQKPIVRRHSQEAPAKGSVSVNKHHQWRKSQLSGQFSGKVFVQGKAFPACVKFGFIRGGNETGGFLRRSGGHGWSRAGPDGPSTGGKGRSVIIGRPHSQNLTDAPQNAGKVPLRVLGVHPGV